MTARRALWQADAEVWLSDTPDKVNRHVAGLQCVAMSDVTLLEIGVQNGPGASAIDDGDEKAANQLLPMVYQELRTLAAARLSKEKSGQTLQPTSSSSSSSLA